MPASTLTSITGLAIVNALNPCALAAMIMVLISILVANEEKRHKVLLGGLAFTAAIFIGYFLYGIVIVQLFKNFFVFVSAIYPYITKILAVLAIILGLFQIKDFLYYKPGGLATEMPLRFRPRMKQIIKAITSTWGAFLAGVFVTIFLLPCTISPYLIALGILSQSMTFGKTIPWIIYYDIIFILPMIATTLIIYWGVSSAEKVSAWRDRNIKRIHLAAGIILILLGVAILTGLI